jgi:hypothetical protein
MVSGADKRAAVDRWRSGRLYRLKWAPVPSSTLTCGSGEVDG